MKKIIRNGNSVIVVLNDGTILQNDSCTDELFTELKACETDDDIALLLLPNLQEALSQRKQTEKLLERIENSKLLSKEGNSVYWDDVSEMSLPQDFVDKILTAEEEGNEEALESYKNFWTLLCLNPDERVRQNLFWFLTNWGMRISRTGLFVGYRNVDIYRDGNTPYYDPELCDFVKEQYDIIRNRKKSTAAYWVVVGTGKYYLCSSHEVEELENNNPHNQVFIKYNLKEVYNELKAVNFNTVNAGDDTVFTDHYTGRMRIKIGEMVTIPREECDCDSGVECSRGLHLGGTSWLSQNYFGEVGLVCLCNPVDVVAIPRDSSYGKLRTCAYLPIARCEYDDNKNVIPYNVEDGFDSHWVKTVMYDGVMSKEDTPAYHIEIPERVEYNKSFITEQVLETARKYMK